MKQQLLQQMSAMDTLLRENFFTASISALVPGVACMLALGGGLRNLISRVRSRRRSRRSLIKQVCAPPHMPPGQFLILLLFHQSYINRADREVGRELKWIQTKVV